ncbi:MAG: M20/M25/M40 family metallo-hydrolase [Steroidobacteraceae bacterium]
MKPAVASLLAALVMFGCQSTSAQQHPGQDQAPEVQRQHALDLLTRLVGINTTHPYGSTQAADYLAAQALAAGFSTQEVTTLAPPGFPERGNVIVRLRGSTKARAVLFIGHLDVVEAKREDWSVDPFQLTTAAGYLYGRGTLDMKGDDVALLTGLMRMKREGYVPKHDVIVALTADEEAGAPPGTNGVDWLLHEHRDLIDAQLAFNPDSGGGASSGDRRLYMGLETSEKIFVTFGLEVTNKGGHSSLPEPDNAIYRLAAGLQRISKLDFPVRTNATTRAWFAAMASLESGQLRQDMLAMTSSGSLDPDAVSRLESSIFYNAMLHSTCVATMINGGHAENALPQRAAAMIQCRMLPDDSQGTVESTLVDALADPDIKVSVITPAAPGPESVATAPIMSLVKSVSESIWPGVPVVPDMDAGASDS